MAEPRTFTLTRRIDETGVSGTGRILDGVIFHTGQVVVCWRTDISGDATGFSSIAIYPNWDAFVHVHIAPHAPGSAEIRFFSDQADAG